MPAPGQNAERNVVAVVAALRRLSRGDDCRRVDLFPSGGTRADINGWQSRSIKLLAKAGVVQIVGDTTNPGARRHVRYRLAPGATVLGREAVARLLYPPLAPVESRDSGEADGDEAGDGLSPRGVARALGCSRQTAASLIESGLLKSRRDESGLPRVRAADVTEFRVAWPPEVPLTPTTVAREAGVPAGNGEIADVPAAVRLLRVVAESLARVHDRLTPLEAAVADCQRVLRALET